MHLPVVNAPPLPPPDRADVWRIFFAPGQGELVARPPGGGAIVRSCAAAVGVATLAGVLAGAAPPPPAAETRSAEAAPSIGTATMLEDGTVLLQLRATGPGGMVGDALLRYPPSDPNYAAVRAHLPALRPGGSVFVPHFE